MSIVTLVMDVNVAELSVTDWRFINFVCASFFRCLELQPDNLTALMALAVSYTNESLQSHACESLLEWLKQNPKYSQIVGADRKEQENKLVSSYMSPEMHDSVKSYLLRAIQISPGEIDPDVQVSL